MRRLGKQIMRILIGSALFFGLAVPFLGSAGSAWAEGATPPCVSQCQPGFDLYAGPMLVLRSPPGSTSIITPPLGTPGTLLDANQFAFSWSGAGAEVTGQWRTHGGWALEGRYFTTQAAIAAHTIPSITDFRVAGIGVTIIGGGSINSSYTSRLSNNGELNVYRQAAPILALLVGLRTINLSETLRSEIATPVTFVEWTDTNQLLGAQVGLRLTLSAPNRPLRFDATLKIGQYRNLAANVVNSTIVAAASDSQRLTSQLGEINLAFSYQVHENIVLRAAYVGLWFNNVALPGEAAANTTQVAGGTVSPVSTGSVWFHGATLGLGLRF
jgi:hypothetical protein